MFKMTKEDALERQATQLAHYAAMYGAEPLTSKLKAATTADALESGVLYDVVIINRHIRRGGWFESNIPEIVEHEAEIKRRHLERMEQERAARRN